MGDGFLFGAGLISIGFGKAIAFIVSLLSFGSYFGRCRAGLYFLLTFIVIKGFLGWLI